MDDVISLSSGDDDDSDIEFVSSYRDDSFPGIPFIRAELLPVTPVLIDITEHHFSSDGPKALGKLKKPPTEITDLKDVSESRPNCTAKRRENVDQPSYSVNLETDVICLHDGNGALSPVSCDLNDSFPNKPNSVQTCFQDDSTQRAADTFLHSSLKDMLFAFEPPKGLPEFFDTQNTNHTQRVSTAPCPENNSDHDERLESPHSWLDKAFSPFSLDSPYYCPSEIDAAVFSDESLVLYSDDPDPVYQTCSLIKPEFTYEVEKSAELQEKTHIHTVSPHLQTRSQNPQKFPPSAQASPPISPTSTELLAGDSPDTGSDLDMESPPLSPVNVSSTPSSPAHMVLGIKDFPVLQAISVDGDGGGDGLSVRQEDDRQQISLAQFRKLEHVLGGRVKDTQLAEEDSKDFGMAEPLCRQSLSLVYSTIEENYTEGTLQLLSDLIQPCHYPPADITAHLLRRILLEPRCSQVQALEAFNLLMRTQKYHPADRSTIPWDWELLLCVMSEQDKARRLHSEVRCLLLQYVLQVLEDDFHFRLPTSRRHLSIANEILSGDNRINKAGELVTWLLDAAKQSVCISEDEEMQKRERNCCLKMLLILQRMLLLAVEVDMRPTCSSNKFSEELCNRLDSMAPCRRLRFLLLSTLQSNLLRCKMVELLLHQSCSQKIVLPMSFKLLLHFLHTSTPAPDPSDGTERWRKWDELLQLVWMLMLSHQEVVTGHLHFSITERFKRTRVPMWTQNDQVTRPEVREAAEVFQSRAVEDLGHDLPSKIQELLSQLQEHLLSISLQ